MAAWEREDREVAHRRERERREGGREIYFFLKIEGYIIPLFIVLRGLASKQSKLILQETKDRVLIYFDYFRNK